MKRTLTLFLSFKECEEGNLANYLDIFEVSLIVISSIV